MKKPIIAIAFSFLFFTTPALAESFSCPDYVEPEIVIKPGYDKPRLDRSRSVNELVVLSKGVLQPSQNLLPAGLTSFEIILSGETQNYYRILPDGNVCAQVSRYELQMNLRHMVVYVASEIPENSCSYYEVVNHEQKHVDAASVALNGVLPVTKKYVRDFLRHQGVVRASSVDAAEEQLQKAFDDYIKGLSASVLKVSEKLQQDVDSKEEYDRLEQVCNGELSKIVNQGAR